MHCLKSFLRFSLLVGVGAFASVAPAAEGPAPAAQPPQLLSPNYPRDDATLGQGQTLFLQLCASCHVIERDAIGPPLGGVTRLLTQAELLRHIRNPAALIASGNLRANALFRRYKIVMPPFDALPEEQLLSILAFIDSETEKSKLTPFAVNLTPPTGQEVRLIPAVEKSSLVIELEDYLQIPLAPNRRPDKGIATVRSSPRKDGIIFVSDQMGVIYRVKDRQSRVYLDIRDQLPNFVFEPGIGTGLGSFAFHPDFVNNGLLYVTHAEAISEKPAINDRWYENVTITKNSLPPLHWVLSEWRATDPAANQFAGTRREVLRIKMPTTTHGCQDVAFAPVTDPKDPDYGMIYLGVGDGGSVNLKMPELAHNPRSLLGTLLRVDPRGTNGPNGQYGIPADNPFAHSSDPLIRREVWAYGFRNPHRMCWDLSYGKRHIVADIGESNVEEVNVIEKGADYGWNKIEGTTRIEVLKDAKVIYPATAAELAPYRMPFGMFDHADGRAISGGFVYAGPLEALRHKYIFGDIVSGRLFFMNLDQGLTDSKVYELNLVRDGMATTVGTLSNVKRVHLRIGYDELSGDMFIMTKEDGRLRRITKAYYR